jgi:arthrofactin-type cyclic lipopeptide synthetase B
VTRHTSEVRRKSRDDGQSVFPGLSLCNVAWAQVLSCTSGRVDVVFGTVLLGRMQSGGGAERALGMFINTLPSRVRVQTSSVEASIRTTHELLTDLLRHDMRHSPSRSRRAPFPQWRRCLPVC